jgi:hypothetical protein
LGGGKEFKIEKTPVTLSLYLYIFYSMAAADVAYLRYAPVGSLLSMFLEMVSSKMGYDSASRFYEGVQYPPLGASNTTGYSRGFWDADLQLPLPASSVITATGEHAWYLNAFARSHIIDSLSAVESSAGMQVGSVEEFLTTCNRDVLCAFAELVKVKMMQSLMSSGGKRHSENKRMDNASASMAILWQFRRLRRQSRPTSLYYFLANRTQTSYGNQLIDAYESGRMLFL